jgi:hypothetical protein
MLFMQPLPNTEARLPTDTVISIAFNQNFLCIVSLLTEILSP